MSRTFTVAAPDGALLQVQEWPADPPGDGPTVVLEHGWTLTRASWLPVIEQLVERGLRVVAYDQRGHGGSGPLRGRPTVRGLGDDLAAVLDVVAPSGPVVLGGHSMGGMTVMAYAGLHPEEFASRVVGVVLVSTSAGDLRRTGLRSLEARAMWLASRMPRVAAGRLVTTRSQRHLLFGAHPDPEHVRLTRDQVASTALPTMGRFYSALSEHDEAEALAQLEGVPTVVLVGDRDRLTPQRHAERLAELVPHAELRVLEGCGHMLGYEATDEVVSALCSVVEAAQAEAR
ncbi:alpha/beta hydrolase [Pedococcus sp.]|jgi:pimeloyl-ACP methyl ester carboxylesterase|uniref:alpha/beta fold hydrolase n=1 Tax=Pedococcus sp. TaxID=2860345 RepID=UPI002E11C983|nr:alpha/beta hydrolase [Pedococcus sp.]